MNRTDLVAAMAEKAGLTKADTDKALGAFIDVVTEALVDGEEVRLIGFGIFHVAHRPETEGRNLRTGEAITIPARNVPKFKPGKQLKDALSAK